MTRTLCCAFVLTGSIFAGSGPASAAEPFATGAGDAPGITQVGYSSTHRMSSAIADESERYASGIERMCLGIKDCIRARRLRGYQRKQKEHRGLLYPQCPPYCSPTFGYHQTNWTPFPETCEYVWSSVPEQVLSPLPPTPIHLQPMADPTPSQVDPTPAPPAAEPYFPEAPPQIFPGITAPPAPEQ